MGAPPIPPDAATRLRALAHPLRWRLLHLLDAEDSATATRCSQVLGESVASCAYHLGILGKYGYVEQLSDTPGRERPWRSIDRHQDLSAPGTGIEDELAAEAALDAFLEHEFAEMRARQHRKQLESAEWSRAVVIGGSTMWVTAAELESIKDELLALLHRFEERSVDPEQRPDGARPARVFFSTSVSPEP